MLLSEVVPAGDSVRRSSLLASSASREVMSDKLSRSPNRILTEGTPKEGEGLIVVLNAIFSKSIFILGELRRILVKNSGSIKYTPRAF